MSTRLFGLAALAATVVLAGCTTPGGPNAASSASSGVAAVLGSDIAGLYTSTPFSGGQQTPAHVWLQHPDGTLSFYHLNHDDVGKATGVLFVGDAIPGNFCKGQAGVSQAQLDAGYVHFHDKVNANWDAAHNHGGNYAATDTQGYWLRHIGAIDGSMQMGGQSMPMRKAQVFHLMPADTSRLQACPGGAGGAETLGALVAPFYNAKPFTGGPSQVNTPEHLWFQQPDGTFLFLHFDNVDPLASNTVLWAGDAFPGRLCKGDAGVTQGEYDAGYVHFHSKDAPNWDAGHNHAGNYAETTKDGYWLRHIGATDATMRMMGMDMTIEKGKVFPMMPADLGQLQAC